MTKDDEAIFFGKIRSWRAILIAKGLACPRSKIQRLGRSGGRPGGGATRVTPCTAYSGGARRGKN